MQPADYSHAFHCPVVLSGGQEIRELLARLPGRARVVGLPGVMGALQAAGCCLRTLRHPTSTAASLCCGPEAQASCSLSLTLGLLARVETLQISLGQEQAAQC